MGSSSQDTYKTYLADSSQFSSDNAAILPTKADVGSQSEFQLRGIFTAPAAPTYLFLSLMPPSKQHQDFNEE